MFKEFERSDIGVADQLGNPNHSIRFNLIDSQLISLMLNLIKTNQTRINKKGQIGTKL